MSSPGGRSAEDDLAADGYTVVTVSSTDLVRDVGAQLHAVWDVAPPEVRYRGVDGLIVPMDETIALIHRMPGYSLVGLHTIPGPVADVLQEPSIADALAAGRRTPIKVLHTEVFEWCRPRPLTRDRWFIPDEPGRNTFTIWLPIDPVHDKAGPWLVHPGSHVLPTAELDDGPMSPGAGSAHPDIVERARADLAVQLADAGIAGITVAREPGELLIVAADTVQSDRQPINVDHTRRALMAVVSAAVR